MAAGLTAAHLVLQCLLCLRCVACPWDQQVERISPDVTVRARSQTIVPPVMQSSGNLVWNILQPEFDISFELLIVKFISRKVVCCPSLCPSFPVI